MARTQDHTKSPKAKRPVNTFGGFEPSSAAPEEGEASEVGDADESHTGVHVEANGETAQAGNGAEQPVTGGSVSNVIQQLDLVKDGFATQIGDIAEKVRVLAPKDGGLGRASEFVVGNLSSAQSFLGNRSTSQVVTYTLAVLRRNPIPFAFGAIGAAFGVLVSHKLEARKLAAGGTSATVKSHAKATDSASRSSKPKDTGAVKDALN